VAWSHWLGSEPVPGSHEHGIEPSGSIKGRDFCDWLSDDQLLKRNYAPWG
jgi:hypothetical protein